MLKDVLDQYDYIGLTTFLRDGDNNIISMHQSVYKYITRKFNDKYIELSTDDENDVYAVSRTILRNNPQDIQINVGQKEEQNITVVYDKDLKVNLVGYCNKVN